MLEEELEKEIKGKSEPEPAKPEVTKKRRKKNRTKKKEEVKKETKVEVKEVRKNQSEVKATDGVDGKTHGQNEPSKPTHQVR